MLADRLSYAGDWSATGLAFAAFGLGGVALAFTVDSRWPALLTRDPQVRARRAQAIIRASLQLYVLALRRWASSGWMWSARRFYRVLPRRC